MRAITFNSSKAALQTFTNKHTLISHTLKLGSDSIHIVTKHKHRGLNISRHLRFNCNTKEIVRKANTELVPLYEVAAHIPRLALMQIYINIFDYADIVYIGHTSVTDSLRQKRVQNRVARLINGAFNVYKRHTAGIGLDCFACEKRYQFLTYIAQTKSKCPSIFFSNYPYPSKKM